MASAVKEKSLIMKDQLIDPQKEVVYWIEYIMRHNGAIHLRSPLKDLSWYVIAI